MRACWLRFVTIVFCFSVPAFAQQTGTATGNATPVARPPVDRRIMLDVVVSDKHGNPIPDLQQSDFNIVDDTQARAILSFKASPSKTDEEPIQAIFLVDAVNTAFRGVSVARQELEKFLRRDGGQLPMPTSLVILTDTATDLQKAPTRDGNSLADTVKANDPGLRVNNRSQGFYGAADRMQISLRALEQLTSYEGKQPGRKLLIWISPGWPLLSGPNVQLTAKNENWIFDNIVGLSRVMREARITLYAVDPLGMSDAGSYRTFYYESFLKGVRSARTVQSGNLALQVLAVQSGGRVLNSSNDVASALASCAIDAKAFYTLSFDSPPADNPNEYHKIEVRVDKPGLTARTRTGYYAQP